MSDNGEEFFQRAVEYTKGAKQESLLSIEVKELQGLKIFYRPLDALTQKEFDRLVILETKGDTDSFIEILLIRACTEDGKRMFNDKIKSKVKMRNEISPFLISRIVGKMYTNEGEKAPDYNGEDIEDFEMESLEEGLKKTDTSND